LQLFLKSAHQSSKGNREKPKKGIKTWQFK
jgi:hypothetical protein